MKKFGTYIPLKLSSSFSSLSIFCFLHYNYLLIFFLPPPICLFVFFKRDERGRVYVRVMRGKNERSIKNVFLLVLTECVFILTPCNINAISTFNCNEQYKEGIGHDSSKL